MHIRSGVGGCPPFIRDIALEIAAMRPRATDSAKGQHHNGRRLMEPARDSQSQVSSQKVTGPSLSRPTFISAPKRPVATLAWAMAAWATR